MLRYVTAIGLAALLGGCAQAPPATLSSNPRPVLSGGSAAWFDIEFETGSYTIGKQGIMTVADIGRRMQQDPAAIATIIGKTDSVGSAGHNMHLSQQRADAVRDELVSQSHVAAERVETRWTGETGQRVATADYTASNENRVVEIAIH
jgi:outer membrane protein OmpA-like peptidoglycan-associated protein